ncbi:MAG: YolD-like family protein [bacterium]
MSDRKMTKWKAFDAVINSQKILNELSLEKEVSSMPILSEDDYIEIEKNILMAFNSKEKITISYFENGKIKSTSSTILRINKYSKEIILENKVKITFDQITNTNL